jgi:hypothetical protein
MPDGFEMFKFHGADGNDCPKAPLIKRETILAEYAMRETREGDFWIIVSVDRKPHDQLGPFATESECRRAYDDLLGMMRSAGAVDLPPHQQ